MYPIVIIIVALAAAFAAPAPAVADDSPAAVSVVDGGRDLTRAEARYALRLLFNGRPASAGAYVDSMAATCHGEPLFLLTRARVRREWLPVDDDNKSDLAVRAMSIHKDLDDAIEVCDQRIDDGDDDPQLRLWRGWAWMFKAHLRTFERSFWKAGREGKKGKNDLAHYLEDHPEDPDAAGILGSFLYFADQISVVIKWIAKMLFMPSGDRDEGLRLLEVAVAQPDASVDHTVFLNSIYILFEGRYEDGLRGFAQAHARYPEYVTLARPFALMAPLVPEHANEYAGLADEIVRRNEELPNEEIEWSSRELLRFLRAYSDRFYAPERALVELEAVANDAPEHPDWIAGYAAFEKGRMLATRGEMEEARRYFGWVLASASSTYLHEDAKKLIDEMEKSSATPPLLHGSTVAKMYEGDTAARQRVIDAMSAVDAPAIHDLFYFGDALLLHGHIDEALSVYDDIVTARAPSWDHPYQLIASSRAAEIYGLRGDYRTAAKRLEKATKYYHLEFLYDWILDGRKRFYERLDKGEETVMPTLFTSAR